MRRISRSALVPYTTQQMFDIVNDVARYGDFLPWCERGIIQQQTDTQMVATVELKANGVRQSFTTVNELDRPNSIKMSLQSGVLTSLNGEWKFMALGDDGCKLSLDLAFDMPRSIAMMGGARMFDSAADKMVEVFCDRAVRLYGV